MPDLTRHQFVDQIIAAGLLVANARMDNLHDTEFSVRIAYHVEDQLNNASSPDNYALGEAYQNGRADQLREDNENNEYYRKRINTFGDQLTELAFKYGMATLSIWIQEWRTLTAEGHPNPKIQLIKKFRSETNCGLKAAKDFVENYVTG